MLELEGRRVEFAASLMCADFMHLGEELRQLQAAGIDRWHFDIMDGHFVPNLTMGPDILSAVRGHSPLPIDVHLMVERPEELVAAVAQAGATRIYFHVESTRTPHRMASAIRDLGCEAGVAVNPATPWESLTTVLPLVEGVLFLCVDPGFAGQSLVPGIDRKIDHFVRHSATPDLQLAADGHIDPKTAKRLVGLGVDGLVLGTASLFRRGVPFDVAMQALRGTLTGHEEDGR